MTPSLHNRHVRGWLSYAFASEVFVIVSLTLFLPICLEQFARDNGFLLPDKSVPCSSVVRTATIGEEEPRCVVKLAWLWIDTASFSLYVYSISVALQALTVISMGGIADHPPHRKRLLLSFASLGSTSAILFLLLPSTSPLWPLAALLAIIANVSFGASVVAMNAYLPVLARGVPEVVEARERLKVGEAREDEDVEHESHDVDDPLLSQQTSLDLLLPASSTPSPQTNYTNLLSFHTSRLSSLGIALGYSSGIILLLLTLVPVTLLKGSTWSLRLAIGLSGVWWGVFTVPAGVWLPGGNEGVGGVGAQRVGGEGVDGYNAIPREDGVGEEELALEGNADPLLVDENGRPWETEDDKKAWSTWREVIAAWKRLGEMLRWTEIKKLRNTFRYLAAWFLLSDGFTTITSTALLFSKTSLNLPPSSLILIGVLTPTAGIIGSLLWPPIQKRYGWSNLKVLVVLVLGVSAVPLYGCLGFLVPREWGVGGLRTQGEMFVLAVYFGSVYGAFQGYARSLYAELIPPGEEARWYGLFSITDKSSSFLGPLLVGIIADLTGNIRYAFFFLVGMIWVAVPVLVGVDVERGRWDAGVYGGGR
ncbi:hypothetical protein JAAARDRAFT_40140 [Jaapia argillacea MUCL 33604]|uniref:Autophagy-related protein n=1 Tax=Jaapia argillacea MUCL 33604 TaxID=933084 RepID=A0A067PFD0_9AGAM|nr:hypothetical protein JAAARDRAFT_40140 [Jaapia argillacea MUCL 33604]